MSDLVQVILALLLAAAGWFGWKQNKEKKKIQAQLSEAHVSAVETKVRHEEEKMKVEDDIYEKLKKENSYSFPKRQRRIAAKLASKRGVKSKGD